MYTLLQNKSRRKQGTYPLGSVTQFFVGQNTMSVFGMRRPENEVPMLEAWADTATYCGRSCSLPI